MADRKTFLVTYDISDPKRLRRVARLMQDYGGRRQLSVFLCRITGAQRVEMTELLGEIIDRSADQILILPLCERCADRLEAVGRPTRSHDADDDFIFC